MVKYKKECTGGKERKNYQTVRSGLSWWLGWGLSHLLTSPPFSSSPLLLRPQRDPSAFALLSAAGAPEDEPHAPFLSGLGWTERRREERRGEGRRDGEVVGKVERWCQWKKRRRRTRDLKQTASTSSDCHKDGLKQGFQIWGDTFQHSFHCTVKFLWTHKHPQVGGSQLSQSCQIIYTTQTTQIKESKHTVIVACGGLCQVQQCPEYWYLHCYLQLLSECVHICEHTVQCSSYTFIPKLSI